VVTLRPNADTAQADFKPSSGSAHSTLVEEAPDDDGDASYVESGTVGHKDLYAYQDLTLTPAAILAVQVGTVARKDDAGSRSLQAARGALRPDRPREIEPRPGSAGMRPWQRSPL
jgi:hypothetical protein